MNAELLKQLNAKSKEKLHDCPGIISFDCGSYGGPFLEYLFPHLKRCTKLMLLHEWRDAKTNLQNLGTLETNKEYVRAYFENPAQLKNTEDYSETLIDIGSIRAQCPPPLPRRLYSGLADVDYGYVHSAKSFMDNFSEEVCCEKSVDILSISTRWL